MGHENSSSATWHPHPALAAPSVAPHHACHRWPAAVPQGTVCSTADAALGATVACQASIAILVCSGAGTLH